MGRRRTKDLDLPPHMRRKGNAYYYDHGYVDGHRRWEPLGSDFAAAKRKWAEIEADEPAPGTVGSLLTYYRTRALPQCAPRTQTDRKAHIKRLEGVFGHMPVDQLRPQDVARYLRHHAHPVAANREIGTLSAAYSCGVEIGLASTNPCREVRRNPERPRDRYVTHEEFAAVKALAKAPVIPVAMNLAYLTGMRLGDLLALRWDQIETEGIRVRQQKTGAKVLLEWTPSLRKAIDAAKQIRPTVRGLHVLCTRSGQPYTVSGFGAMFRRVMDKAVAEGVERFTFHDIRAKCGTDARAAGLDSQALLGHTTEAQHQTYLRSKATVKVTPIEIL